MVPAKFFQQLLRNLDDPQRNAIRNQHHWRAPILCSSARKVTYHLFNLDILKVALEKQNTVTLQEQVQWNGDTQVTDYPSEMDPREALACEQQMYFRSSLRKITSAISSCEAISVTSVFLHQSEFGSSFCGANSRGLYVGISMSARKTKWRKMGRVH